MQTFRQVGWRRFVHRRGSRTVSLVLIRRTVSCRCSQCRCTQWRSSYACKHRCLVQCRSGLGWVVSCRINSLRDYHHITSYSSSDTWCHLVPWYASSCRHIRVSLISVFITTWCWSTLGSSGSGILCISSRCHISIPASEVLWMNLVMLVDFARLRVMMAVWCHWLVHLQLLQWQWAVQFDVAGVLDVMWYVVKSRGYMYIKSHAATMPRVVHPRLADVSL